MSARVQRALVVRPDAGRVTASDATSPRHVASRILLVVLGTALSSYGYLLTAAAGVGNGPLFAVQEGLVARTGLSTGTASMVLAAVIVALAVALRAPLGVGTLVIPVVAGLWIDALEPLTLSFDPLWARWAAFVAGTVVMMLGAVVSVTAALGASAMDGVMLSLARRTGRTPAGARIVMEVVMAGLGFAIGGRIGLGTVAMGLSVGPLFGFWSRQLGRYGLEVPSSASARHAPEVAG